MKNLLLIVTMVAFLSSCEEKKVEFIPSRAYDNFFLIKNPPKNNSLLKVEITQFITKKLNANLDDNYYRAVFYRYTTDTEYFLEHKEHDGGPTSHIFLDHYIDDKLATFIISKCENDTTKSIGNLYFYGLEGANKAKKDIDTLIYQCR